MKALKAILKVNLKDTETGPMKIEKGEFVIQENYSLREIGLAKPWESCFFPAQKVSMSMVFRNITIETQVSNYCPHCDTEAEGATEAEIVWYVAPLRRCDSQGD